MSRDRGQGLRSMLQRARNCGSHACQCERTSLRSRVALLNTRINAGTCNTEHIHLERVVCAGPGGWQRWGNSGHRRS
eukprot:5194902-Lingulodinium_polyedra.AAC.1